MSFKVVVLCTVIAIANAGYLESGLRYASPLTYSAPAPIAYHNYVSPAVTKTDYIPGSYSSSYRSDVVTPRVQYTETPGYSYAVPQPPAIHYAPTVTKVAHLEPVVRALPVIAPAPIARVGYGHGFGYAGVSPLAYGGLGFGYARSAPLAYGGLGFGYAKSAPLALGGYGDLGLKGFARTIPVGHSTYGGYY